MGITMQCFVLCRSVTTEHSSRLQTIDRVFDLASTTQLPAKHGPCALHVRFFIPDQPTCTVSIVLESPVGVKSQILQPISTNPNPNGMVQLTRTLKELVLPDEGLYTFRLLVDEKVCSEYYLTVIKRRPRRAAPEPPLEPPAE